MWDGFWFLANKRAWERLPANMREILAKNINAAGMKEREDVAALNAGLQKDLTDKGMIFNTTTPESFRAQLTKAGFYKEWQGKYGNEAWALLEKYSGKLA
jgi:TRAP-type C4-dicarboxylate transport system substrate-binding protein